MDAELHRTSRAVALVVVATALILSLPLVAMLLTDAVAWGPVDFALAGALLLALGLGGVAARRVDDTAYTLAVGVALAATLLFAAAILAVGAIGEPGDPADLMYAGVLVVGVLGAAVARFRPQGMARAVLAMALAQAVVVVIALIAGKHEAPSSSVLEIVGPNAAFAALFVASAWLFRHAARAGSAGREAGA